MTQSEQEAPSGSSDLKVAIRRSEQRKRLRAAALVAPLLLYLVVIFLVPIVLMLYRAIDNPELAEGLPRTVEALAEWDGRGVPDEPLFAALGQDLIAGSEGRAIAQPARRLNYEISGFRSLVMASARKLTRLESEPSSWRDTLVEIDKRWEDPAYWAAIRKAAPDLTPFYLLSALDLKVADGGEIVRAGPNEAIYIDLYLRTLWISLIVVAVCVVLGYPVAFLLANVSAKWSNLLLILVLLPFWTSLLVRTSAWVVLLQKQGVVNETLQWLGLVEAPLQLVFNRTGVYIAMVHILLPFLILPLYSVMKGINPWHMKAAMSLGANPLRAFLAVYLPQSLPGVAAGCLLVFILAIGYYITPALVGGPQDQMISYYIAYFTNQTVNWGLAAALAVTLLTGIAALYVVYARLVGIDRLRLG